MPSNSNIDWWLMIVNTYDIDFRLGESINRHHVWQLSENVGFANLQLIYALEDNTTHGLSLLYAREGVKR